MGEVAGKYQKMLQEQSGLDLKKNKHGSGKRFDIIVEGGQVFFKCIDKFDEIFSIDKDSLGGQPIVDVLDPFTFDNHKDIIDALFEVYHDLSEQYEQSGVSLSQDETNSSLYE